MYPKHPEFVLERIFCIRDIFLAFQERESIFFLQEFFCFGIPKLEVDGPTKAVLKCTSPLYY